MVLFDQKKNPYGSFFINDFSIQCHYSFLDLYNRNQLNIIPVIGVDFSLANLTFDLKKYCIHTLKEDAPNDYMDCLKSVAKAFNYFNRFMVPIGFGSKTIFEKDLDFKVDLPASNLFAMTGDFFQPYVETSE